MDAAEKESRRKAIEFAARRRSGATREHAARVSETFLSAHDLYGHCIGCGHVRRGSLKELKTPCPHCGHGEQG